MMNRVVTAILAIGVTLVVGVRTPAQARGGGGGGGGDEVRLTARMGGNNALTAKGVYRERIRSTGLQQRFKVEIERATPNVTYTITVNGSVFGTITANSLGRAELEFHSFTFDDNPHDEEPPLPDDFPRLAAGATITVGALSGTFR